MTKENKELTQMGVLDCAAKTNISDLGIKQADKAVLLALCMHIYKDISNGYYCNPSLALLEKEIGLASRTISKSIGILQDAGFVKSQASKYSNTYFINAEKIVEMHNLWRQAFKDEKVKVSPYKAVSSSALAGFSKAENKSHDHKRNTSGFVQNQAKAVTAGYSKMFHGVTYYSESEYESAKEQERIDRMNELQDEDQPF